MNFAGKLILGTMTLIVILFITISFILPKEAIFEQVTQSIEAATGRSLSIQGEKSLSLFPQLKLQLNDVRLANTVNASRKDMATVAQIDIQLSYLSVLMGNISLDKFVITDPDILLEKASDGSINWQLPAKLEGARPSNEERKEDNNAPSILPTHFDVNLGKVAIVGGKIRYVDHQANTQIALSGFNLSVDLPTLNETFAINGKFDYQGQTFDISTTIDTPAKLLVKDDFTLNLALNAELFKLNFIGDVTQKISQIKGSFTLEGQSLKHILAWQGHKFEAQNRAYNQFLVKSDILANKHAVNFNELKLHLDALKINGSAKIEQAKIPKLTASIDLGMLDLNPYLPPISEKARKSETDEASKQHGKSQPIVWDDSKVDLGVLNAMNARVDVSAEGLKARKITLGENQFSLTINNGDVQFTLKQFQAYEGHGEGHITLNAKQIPYQLATAFKFSGIQAKPLLSDVAGFQKLIGKGQFSWQFNAIGNSQRSFIKTLNGDLNFSLSDGAIQGANLAALARSVKSVFDKGITEAEGLSKGFSKAESTDFSEFVGQFSFVKGVSDTNSITMKSPLLRVTGNGEVNLPLTQVNYRIVTGIVSTIEGQGSTDTSTGFKIPVRIQGPFHQVELKPDLSSVVKEEAKDKIKNKLKNKLKDLF